MLDKVEDELLQNKRQVTQLTAENKRLTDQNKHTQVQHGAFLIKKSGRLEKDSSIY